MKDFDREIIIVLDFGGQHNQVIARRIREVGVYSELRTNQLTAEAIREIAPKGIVLAGGPREEDAKMPACDPAIFDLGIPILGIGYGMTVISEHLGGKVEAVFGEGYAKEIVKIEGKSELLGNDSGEHEVTLNLGHAVTEVPAGFIANGVTAANKAVAMSDDARKIYGVQFHPEVGESELNDHVFRQFALNVCQCGGYWTMANFIEKEIEAIRKQVGDKKVLCALSGGVDSSVVAAIIHKAVGDQLTCMFIDHGLLRKGEADSVMETFGEGFHMNVIKIDARERFLSKLAGVSDPEEKRKIIGNEFIYLFEEESNKLEGMDYLAQGTIYTDIIESGSETSKVIKSHHNVGGLPEDMKFELVEPLKALFKDEVREVGKELGLPDEIVWRQPFPGPGLGIRVLGEVTEEKLKIVRESDAVLREEIANAGLDRSIWQYFTVLPNVRSVGTLGNERTYDYTIGIRAVHSVDGMTSNFAHIPWDVLEHISKRIVAEVAHVNRVVYDITSKPPATIEWE